MRAEHLPQLLVAALADQVQVDLAQRGQEPVGVVLPVLEPVAVVDQQPVVGLGRDVELELPDALEVVLHVVDGAVLQLDLHRRGERPQHPDRHAAVSRVRAEDAVRVAVPAVDEQAELVQLAGRIRCGGAGVASAFVGVALAFVGAASAGELLFAAVAGAPTGRLVSLVMVFSLPSGPSGSWAQSRWTAEAGIAIHVGRLRAS